MTKFHPIMASDYGPLDPKVDLKPDFFTGFQPERRKEIVAQEAAFYHGITQPYSVDAELQKRWITVKAKNGREVPVKVYEPKGSASALPALIFMHGGGFITCSVETHDYVPSYLAAKANVRAFSVEYALAPEAKFPEGLEECYDAVQWIWQNAEALKVDPTRLILCGDSSGGNFAAVIAQMCRDRGGAPIHQQVLIYAATDFTGKLDKQAVRAYAPVGGDDGGETFLQRYLNDVEAECGLPYVSPIMAKSFEGLPPALLIQAECDALCDDGLIYGQLLKDAGVPVACHIYKGMPHAFILRTYEETFAALDEICRFIRS